MLDDKRIVSDAAARRYPTAHYVLERQPAAVSGVIVAGAQLGRAIGLPTANMVLDENVELDAGIYAVHFVRESGQRHFGVSSFGRRPTVVENGELILETHVLDFHGDLYGEICSVQFVEFLRSELRFEGVGPMIDQIRQDVVLARAILEGRSGEGGIAREADGS